MANIYKPILPPPAPPPPKLHIVRDGIRTFYAFDREDYHRIYTSAAIAKRVAALVEWWFRSLPNPALPRNTLWACIERAEMDAVAELRFAYRSKYGRSHRERLPKHFDDL